MAQTWRLERRVTSALQGMGRRWRHCVVCACDVGERKSKCAIATSKVNCCKRQHKKRWRHMRCLRKGAIYRVLLMFYCSLLVRGSRISAEICVCVWRVLNMLSLILPHLNFAEVRYSTVLTNSGCEHDAEARKHWNAVTNPEEDNKISFS